jgi:protein SCO1/2
MALGNQGTRTRVRLLMAGALFLISSSAWAAQQYSASGMVLKVDQTRKTFVVSCKAIPGFMDAMTMPFDVRSPKDLDGVVPGAMVEFTLVVDHETSYVENIIIRKYESVEQDPLTARRLKLLNQLSDPKLSDPKSSAVKSLTVGQAVPNFHLIDQRSRRVSLAQFRGKVVAINFIYTSCALPNFCFRNTNTFGALQKRFKDRLGRDLILLTVTFDPARDQPDVLARYASTWKADPATWHFLTGPVPEVQRVNALFGMDFFPDEGLMTHSLHTAIIDRRGRLFTNIEGNQFTADQLGDLVQTVLSGKNDNATSAAVAGVAKTMSASARP